MDNLTQYAQYSFFVLQAVNTLVINESDNRFIFGDR